jgi:hypothetical protein
MIPKYVLLEHTSCIDTLKCNSFDKYSKNLITKESSSSVIITTDPYWQFDIHCLVLLVTCDSSFHTIIYNTGTFHGGEDLYSRPTPIANLPNADSIIHMKINMWVSQKISKQVFF